MEGERSVANPRSQPIDSSSQITQLIKIGRVFVPSQVFVLTEDTPAAGRAVGERTSENDSVFTLHSFKFLGKAR
ncbi:hypothetical protein D3C87_1717190 [compost metagenome]